jgi:hypothetical protein
MKVNLKLMVEHLQETGSVLYRKGDVREAIKELYQMGYEVYFDPGTDCLILDNVRRNGNH